MADNGEIIQVPNNLQNKVSYSSTGVDVNMLERAEAVIASLQNEYLVWVEEDLKKIRAAFEKAMAAQPEDRAPFMKMCFTVAHDMKGQGGSFGYQLVTLVGSQLCRFLQSCDHWGAAEMQAVQLHIDAVALIIKNRIQGEGGAEGEGLVRGLQAVVSKFTK